MRKPRTPKELGFETNDLRNLTQALELAQDVRTFRRLQAVLLVARGLPVSETAEITLSKPASVYLWIRKFLQTHQPDSLKDEPRSGRPRAAPQLTDEILLAEIAKDPLSLGYRSTGWTVTLLATHLEREFGIKINPRTLRRRMHEAGLEWKRPRYVYAEKDANRAQKKGLSFVV